MITKFKFTKINLCCRFITSRLEGNLNVSYDNLSQIIVEYSFLTFNLNTCVSSSVNKYCKTLVDKSEI